MICTGSMHCLMGSLVIPAALDGDSSAPEQRVPQMTPAMADPAEIARLEGERDLYLRLLNLGLQDEPEPFLEQALELVTRVVGAHQGYLEIDPQGGRDRVAALVGGARLLGRRDRRRPAGDLARHHRRGAEHRRDHRHRLGAGGRALRGAAQRARRAHRGGAVRTDRQRAGAGRRSTCSAASSRARSPRRTGCGRRPSRVTSLPTPTGCSPAAPSRRARTRRSRTASGCGSSRSSAAARRSRPCCARSRWWRRWTSTCC